MPSILIVALCVTTILCVLLSVILLLVWKHMRSRDELLQLRRWAWEKENDRLKGCVRKIVSVLEANVGGISKRINENTEAAISIKLHAPQLFVQHGTLAYWLDANDQFLCALGEAASDLLQSQSMPAIHQDRHWIFQDIYDGAGLTPPVGNRADRHTAKQAAMEHQS